MCVPFKSATIDTMCGLLLAICLATPTLAEGEATALNTLDRSDGKVQVVIEKIVKDTRIAGLVTGLSAEERDKYKVVVYVHTDKWYVHPYAGQGRGKSWALIEEDGRWSVRSVKRAFVADQVGALVVPLDFAEPPTLTSLFDVDESVCWIIVEGTGDV